MTGGSASRCSVRFHEKVERLDTFDDGATATPDSKKAQRLAVELDRKIDEVVASRHELKKQLDAADRPAPLTASDVATPLR